MKLNEGNLDRTLRIILGIGIISLVFWGPETAWGYLGVIPLITGVVGFCPLYKIVGLNTCPLSKKH